MLTQNIFTVSSSFLSLKSIAVKKYNLTPFLTVFSQVCLDSVESIFSK